MLGAFFVAQNRPERQEHPSVRYGAERNNGSVYTAMGLVGAVAPVGAYGPTQTTNKHWRQTTMTLRGFHSDLVILDALRVTIIAEHKWATETLTAEHHPFDRGGMKYCIRIIGGKHHGIEIHCPTRSSALRLFDQLMAYRGRYDDHPFLVAV